jgi:hypothetical protein
MRDFLVYWLIRSHNDMFDDFATIALVGAAGVVIYQLLEIFNSFLIFCKNRKLMLSQDNLTAYGETDRTELLCRKHLSAYKVFRKCNCTLNLLYWGVKTRDAEWFYTDSNNSIGTLHKIVATIKLKVSAIDDFFDYILGSALLREDLNLLQPLSDCDAVRIPYSEVNMRASTLTSSSSSEFDEDVPDMMYYHLSVNDQELIIGCYNGTCTKNISDKVLKLTKVFPKARIVVFASGTANAQRTAISAAPTFVLYSAGNGTNNDLAVMESIDFHGVSISSTLLNETYLSQFQAFSSEIMYWLHCYHQQRIVST